MNTTDLQARIITNLSVKAKRLDRSLYELPNNDLLLFRTSKAHNIGTDKYLYWFGYHRDRLEKTDANKLAIVYVCGNENQCIVIPALKMLEFLRNVETASDDNWKIQIHESKGRFELVLTGKAHEDVTEYLNRFDLVNESEKIARDSSLQTEEISVEDEIMSLDGVSGKSLHDRLAFMLRQIGEWMGYKAIQEYMIRPDVPYRLDVAWLLNDAIHIAIEVQVSGNATEAKDRLILAKRFGARKLIIVSTPENVERIKGIFRYETDVKHWLEIWGVESIYNMFVDGRSFFETYNQFNKHEYRGDVTEII